MFHKRNEEYNQLDVQPGVLSSNSSEQVVGRIEFQPAEYIQGCSPALRQQTNRSP